MTREIKFRVWDGSQMNYHVLAGKLGVFYASIDPKDTASVINTKYPENIIPMQYTGLKDENGIEIYEGDILRSILHVDYTIEWDSENARFLGFTIPDRKIIYVGREPKAEIIGNIYQ